MLLSTYAGVCWRMLTDVAQYWLQWLTEYSRSLACALSHARARSLSLSRSRSLSLSDTHTHKRQASLLPPDGGWVTQALLYPAVKGLRRARLRPSKVS
jgi:hypothetical protein